MAIFFTHIMTANGLIADPEGQHFPTLEDASAATEVSARHLVADAIRNGENRVTLEFQIEDKFGVRLAILPVDAKITGGNCIPTK
ncbi:hypothetical protein IFT54_19690 [Sphingomonas sp. CFBP 13714]|uniref:DUF6894 family protein n=1 Tax=Sphingomonas sp. CFBP 13714 TaxID=2775308 RepID=UPI001783DC99|nr:hypothetical protein [Sphingomonas sp. CFBP 13714]MBD8702033.1 hypothetical protein [Sphingomonas sp. CFBP 13714]